MKKNTYSGMQTTAIHAGEGPDPATNASAPPLHMSSTFVSNEAAGFSAHDLLEDSPWLYARWANPTVSMLEKKIAALFDELGIEKLNVKTERDQGIRLNLKITDLNQTIVSLNNKLAELKQALTISSGNIQTKEIEIDELKLKLDTAFKNKIGELSEYRSEFFGRLKEILKDQREINIVGDRFVLQSEIIFNSGSATIGDKGKKKISEITTLLKIITKKIPNKIDWIIQIEGHTDNVPISTEDFPSNWELSVARAIAVSKIMIINGIEPNRINVAGYGEFRPLVRNSNKQNKKQNRRIELKLTQP